MFGAWHLGAATLVSAQREDDGSVTVVAAGPTHIGAFAGRESEPAGTADALDAVEAALSGAGLPTTVTDDIAAVAWGKAATAAAVFIIASLSALRAHDAPASAACGRVHRFPGPRSRIDRASSRGRPNRCPRTARRLVHAGPPEVVVRDLVARASTPPAGPSIYPSMTQDILASGATEIEEVIGDLVRRADAALVPVPLLRDSLELLRGVAAGTT